MSQYIYFLQLHRLFDFWYCRAIRSNKKPPLIHLWALSLLTFAKQPCCSKCYCDGVVGPKGIFCRVGRLCTTSRALWSAKVKKKNYYPSLYFRQFRLKNRWRHHLLYLFRLLMVTLISSIKVWFFLPNRYDEVALGWSKSFTYWRLLSFCGMVAE